MVEDDHDDVVVVVVVMVTGVGKCCGGSSCCCCCGPRRSSSSPEATSTRRVDLIREEELKPDGIITHADEVEATRIQRILTLCNIVRNDRVEWNIRMALELSLLRHDGRVGGGEQ
jgi:hypothetical protein